MPSSLTWLDHDAQARDRARRILSLFEERDTRDELGLGAIRDSFSDLLFPGTSTVHTRLRYFLIIPWVYRRIEADPPRTHEIPSEARRLELDIVESLSTAGDSEGVIGGAVGRALKTLPSAIYWAGLRRWQVRRFEGSRTAYHMSIEGISSRRAKSGTGTYGDAAGPRTVTWDPGLPAPPSHFPELTTLQLRRDEADFLQDRVVQTCPGTLLAHFFLRGQPVTAPMPWEQPEANEAPPQARHLLEQGRTFSAATHGSSLLYNLVAARTARREDTAVEYEERLSDWRERTDFAELDAWDLDELWEVTADSGHRITAGTRHFVQEWLERIVETDGDVADDQPAGSLIRDRERRVKGGRARLQNPRLLDQWGGASSPNALDYRWSQVRTFVNDLSAGLAR